MVKNNNRSNLQKRQLCTCSTLFCTFLCRCFARLQRETFRNFLVTLFMEEMSYVFSYTFFSLPLIFTLPWCLLAFLVCHRRYKIFMLFFQKKNQKKILFLSKDSGCKRFFLVNYLNWSLTRSVIPVSVNECVLRHNTCELSLCCL